MMSDGATVLHDQVADVRLDLIPELNLGPAPAGRIHGEVRRWSVRVDVGEATRHHAATALHRIDDGPAQIRIRGPGAGGLERLHHHAQTYQRIAQVRRA